MPGVGVEPTCLAASDLKSGASAIPPPGHAGNIYDIRETVTPGNLCLTNSNAMRYYMCLHMIATYRDKDAAKLMSRESSRRLPPNIHKTAYRKLLMLDAATTLDDLKIPPGNQLEKLSKDRVGQYSIRINDQWRICFRWHQGNAHEVEITNYHK